MNHRFFGRWAGARKEEARIDRQLLYSLPERGGQAPELRAHCRQDTHRGVGCIEQRRVKPEMADPPSSGPIRQMPAVKNDILSLDLRREIADRDLPALKEKIGAAVRSR